MQIDTAGATVTREQDGILIVVTEDISQALRTKLTDKGYDCYQVSHDEQALHHLKTNRIALVILDIGKIGVKDFVLNKPTRLNDEETKQVRCHQEIGEHILTPILNDAETLKPVRNHHEQYDGTGYPDRLTNSQIPLGTRILAVADAYDAMSITMKNGSPATQGVCPTCGTKMFRIGKS